MKRIDIAALAIVGLIIVGALAFVAANVQADTGQISSTVTIECPAEVIANGGSLDFGYLAAPGNGFCDYWTVSPNTGDPLSHSGSGDGIDFVPTDHSKGNFAIKGSELIYYYVYVSTDFADPNLTLDDLTLNPESPQDPSPTSGDCSTLEISVGGTLQVCPGATQGLHNDAVITIVANY